MLTKTAQSEKEIRQFMDPKREWRRLFCEFWGTFLLVLVACGGIVTQKMGSEITLGMRVVAPGLMVMVIIYFMGTVSGAHLNPAVTIAFSLRSHFPWKRVPAYLFAQLAGGLVAAFFLRAMFGDVGDVGATKPGLNLEPWKALIIEIILTTGLVNVILGVSSGPRNVGHNSGLAVGAYICVAGLWAEPLSGASMNPFRSLAPDIARSQFGTTWIYIVGPLIGCLLAVWFEWMLKGKPSERATIEAQGLDGDEK